ncbi:helix-turn-helix domain-containing protein [Sulfitobacter sp. D35]|uniref:helix-turn-helix transcriptional regulator n=1 Tax=Sulfitobacter sp. D35 TaxID=3083252 RepID=UPI00296F59A9|nr:helix-turn-helix domain-containing protein [Sulfitobacter sp. D35]MDW4496354.1 helix-turn-helix domain-containing protein [Sulfitobacter sp. D35]
MGRAKFEPILVDTSEAAQMLGVSASLLEKWRFFRDPDAPPYTKIGRCIRYRIADLRAWADERASSGDR